ncbi:50S ribosomal protein L3 [Candidatus Venteria ishoeyi]|uniref:Large ribosomal subunit protein uL3 n=1 Tax=Candidatus Venteria ishoeyi TaxID=1899563 RepID=A0A1H6F763_9GAMM|nr:50S ribosomal protein L3 [Candidatus Venteria ishoeyi]MDM8545900.1 50S ribosomal protein L3 [Candidatus Venteria ishoeyi]SEH05980.1 50S ribosomal protein L3 [Candidatus Venteria ishoeyi]
MSIGMVGRKCGMTRIFQDDGSSVPVTVIEMEPNRITQIKTEESEGYSAVQVTCGTRKPIRVNKATAGHLAKAEVEAGRGFWEFRLSQKEVEGMQTGSDIKVDIFQEVAKVDVAGTSKGRGFAGVVKRHNFKMQDATHGNSLSHRAPGSIGQNQSPGRVFKGKKMAGQMGNVRCTVQSLEVVRVDVERNLLLVKGGVPGAPGSDVFVKAAVKAK